MDVKEVIFEFIHILFDLEDILSEGVDCISSKKGMSSGKEELDEVVEYFCFLVEESDLLKSARSSQIWLSFFSLLIDLDKEDSLRLKGFLELVEEKEILLEILEDLRKENCFLMLTIEIFFAFDIRYVGKTSKGVVVFFGRVGVIKRFPRIVIRFFNNKWIIKDIINFISCVKIDKKSVKVSNRRGTIAFRTVSKGTTTTESKIGTTRGLTRVSLPGAAPWTTDNIRRGSTEECS